MLNAVTPSTDYRLSSDISYGAYRRQELDVYQPIKPRSVPAPVIVFFYGGSWNGGDRGDYRFVGQLFRIQLIRRASPVGSAAHNEQLGLLLNGAERDCVAGLPAILQDDTMVWP